MEEGKHVEPEATWEGTDGPGQQAWRWLESKLVVMGVYSGGDVWQDLQHRVYRVPRERNLGDSQVSGLSIWENGSHYSWIWENEAESGSGWGEGIGGLESRVLLCTCSASNDFYVGTLCRQWHIQLRSTRGETWTRYRKCIWANQGKLQNSVEETSAVKSQSQHLKGKRRSEVTWPCQDHLDGYSARTRISPLPT